MMGLSPLSLCATSAHFRLQFAKMADYGMKEEHRSLLRKHRVTLVRDLEPKKILEHMAEILDSDDRDEIDVCSTRSNKAEKLLDLLPRKGPKAFEQFVQALMEKQKHLGELLLTESGIKLPEQSSDAYGMSKQQREILLRNAPVLHNMNLKEILPYLLNAYIDHEEENQIMEIRSKSGKVDKLLDILMRQGPKAFNDFVRGLERVQPNLAKPLLQEAGMQPLIKKPGPGTNDETVMHMELPVHREEHLVSNQKASHGNCNLMLEKSVIDTEDRGVSEVTQQIAGLNCGVSHPLHQVPHCLGELEHRKLSQIADKIEKGSCLGILAELQGRLKQDGRGSLRKLLSYAKDLPIREFTELLKSEDRKDVVEEMRKILPYGVTGPLLAESTNIRDLKFTIRRNLTMQLCVNERWKFLAEEINMKPIQIQFLSSQKNDNPADDVLRFWEVKAHSTVKHLYDALVKLDYAIIADTL